VHVVATAGHVDHGKSTLVRALTGMEPDRWTEERRRGMTIDLGFAWTDLPSGATVAFVDVPGHERFVGNMLAGVGPVPAVLFVVAADEGWMPQSAEHLDALHALGVAHGLLAVTRSDRADPSPARDRALAEIAATSLAGVDAVAVSGLTGAGLDRLRAALDRLVGRLPAPDPAAPVRLWADRTFTVRGSGTVVTGTLPAGTLAIGDELELAPGRQRVVVRGLQSLGRPRRGVTGTARVAANLRGLPLDRVRRGAALLTPDRWLQTDLVDVRLHGPPGRPGPPDRLPEQLTLHLGSAALPARIRPLGTDAARLRLARPLPLRIGDRGLLRDPGLRQVAAGVTVLDVSPPALDRRGAAAGRAATLSTMDGQPNGAAELRRRGLVRLAELRAMGAESPVPPVVGDWVADPAGWAALRTALADAVDAHAAAHPLEHGLPVEAARRRLGLPDLRLVTALATAPLVIRDGRITGDTAPELPAGVREAVQAVRRELAATPFAAPEAHRLAELGLGARELAAAVRAGALCRLADGVYLLPDAPAAATRVLAGLAEPFTLSAAREALGTTRRVAVPLLELLDARGATERLPDSRRRLRRSPPAGEPADPAAAPPADA
jgi:selenocysteine-specific elongation factor